MVSFRKPNTDPALQAEAERIHHAWNAALEAHDAEGLAQLYAEDAALESPLVAYLLRTKRGVLKGRDALRRFFPLVFAHQPAERKTFRYDIFFDGRTMLWEYPRATPDGDQMDFTEVMEIVDGKIFRHRVYWGWFGVDTLTSGSHTR